MASTSIVAPAKVHSTHAGTVPSRFTNSGSIPNPTNAEPKSNTTAPNESPKTTNKQSNTEPKIYTLSLHDALPILIFRIIHKLFRTVYTLHQFLVYGIRCNPLSFHLQAFFSCLSFRNQSPTHCIYNHQNCV